MSDPLDDLLNMRLAGYYEAGHDDPEDPPHPWQARPGAMLTATELLDRMHTAEAKVQLLDIERRVDREAHAQALAERDAEIVHLRARLAELWKLALDTQEEVP